MASVPTCDICHATGKGRLRPLRPESPDSVVLCSGCLDGVIAGEIPLPSELTG